jgi:hypothetical protein
MTPKLLSEYYCQKIKSDAPQRAKDKGDYYKNLADSLGISYFTLNNKLNRYGKFTKKQLELLKGLYGHNQAAS